MDKILKNVLDVCDIPPAYHPAKPGKPPLRNLPTSSVPSPHEKEIIDYMRRGIDCSQCPDGRMQYDILRTDARVRIDDVLAADGLQDVDSNTLYTDGEWIWAGATIYYINRYHLPIPDDFVKFAKSNHWQIDETKIKFSELDPDSFYK
jgi:hypothetical protein